MTTTTPSPAPAPAATPASMMQKRLADALAAIGKLVYEGEHFIGEKAEALLADLEKHLPKL